MKIIHTHLRSPTDFDDEERESVYNGLDCCLTSEILPALRSQMDEYTSRTYDFSRRLQGPVLEMRLRGVLVDQARKSAVIDELFEKVEQLEAQLERIVLDGVGLVGFNWRSNDDLKHLFYDRLQLPEQKYQGRVTTNRAALEKLEQYLLARQIVRHILMMRDLAKRISVLRTEVDPDGRIRTSYNIAGTNTGRFSSSESEFGTGTNLQNLEEFIRAILIADKGWKFGKFDAKQIQSRIFGAMEWNALADASYLDACESDDLHTLVAIMTWPDVPWTGDPAKDRALAEAKYYRHFSRRDLSKKLGHGSNFEGKPPTLSAQTGVPLNLVIDFQPKYFKAFPVHLKMHEWIDNQIRRTGTLISLDGRKRQFWGRRNDPETLRGAIAFGPQATEAYIVNTGLHNIWQRRDALVMLQDHDANTVMYREEDEERVIPLILKQLEVPMTLAKDRPFLVPYDCQVGWNRGKWDPKTNPDGLKDWTGHDDRKRTPPIHFLDRKR